MERTNIRKAIPSDLDRIMQIYDIARDFMVANGNESQWAGGYPQESLLKDDIAKHQLYVIEQSGEIHGVFAFIVGDDRTYSVIEQGQWLSADEYGTIHRIAGDGKVKGMMQSAVEFCWNEIHHLRIDTHENNLVMRHLIEKLGFRQCGIIHVDDGTPRSAYEKI